MKSIIRMLWGICLLRQSPARMPGNSLFVALMIAANFVVSLLVSLSLTDEGPSLFAASTGIVVGLAVTTGLVRLLLTARGVASRFNTVLGALLGCDSLLTACLGLALPLLTTVGTTLIPAAFLIYLCWSIAVSGHVLRHALDIHIALGTGLAIGISLISMTVGQMAIAP